MRTRWLGIVVVAALAAGVIAYKHYRTPNPPARAIQIPVTAQTSPAVGPEVILVADLSEANDPGDNCAEIIHLVSNAERRGIKTQELSAESHSPIIKRYHVLTIPTVLVLNHGKVVSRYAGESNATVNQIRDRLASLHKAQS